MSEQENTEPLTSIVEDRLKRINTTSLDISFNELLSMVEQNELKIRPEYQRLFQWSEGKQSRFIESLLLEMPIPPIYVIEVDEGRYELIDGLQRLSTYLHLRGELESLNSVPPIRHGEVLRMSDCDLLPELEGKTYNDLDTTLKIRLRRAFVRVEVVRKGNDRKFAYHMFKRLNTGGETLNEQQIRNCTIRMLDSSFIDFVQELSSECRSFKNCIAILTEQQFRAQFDDELVLRFFAMKNDREAFRHDISDFLTDYMEKVAGANGEFLFDYESEKRSFVKTFDVLDAALGEFSFGIYDPRKQGIKRQFGVLQFEGIALGLQRHLDNLDSTDSNQMKRVQAALEGVKENIEFQKAAVGAGKNSAGLLRKRIELVEQALEASLAK